MTSQHDKSKRWRPRFSVRTLVIVVTLVCCYAACWGPTKSKGVEDMFFEHNCYDSKVLMPLIIVDDRYASHGNISPAPPLKRRYYFWFFGYVAKLPFEREV